MAVRAHLGRDHSSIVQQRAQLGNAMWASPGGRCRLRKHNALSNLANQLTVHLDNSDDTGHSVCIPATTAFIAMNRTGWQTTLRSPSKNLLKRHSWPACRVAWRDQPNLGLAGRLKNVPYEFNDVAAMLEFVKQDRIRGLTWSEIRLCRRNPGHQDTADHLVGPAAAGLSLAVWNPWRDAPPGALQRSCLH